MNASPLPQAPKRVCFVTVEFHGLFKNGGIGTANTALAAALADSGFEVTVAFANADASGPRLSAGGDWNDLKAHWASRGINLDYVPPLAHITGGFDDPRTNSFCIYLYLQEAGFDIVFFNDNSGQGYYSLLAKHVGIFRKPPLFYVVAHGPIDWVHELNAQEYYSRAPIIMAFMERRSVALADVFVSPSRYLLDWMIERHWTGADRGVVIQNLVGVDAAPEQSIDVSQASPISEIVFFGRQETRKGITLFCDAIERLDKSMDLSSVRITFLGKFSRIAAFHSGVYLVERARKWRAAPRILVGYDQADALDYLRKPGILAVIPSRAENSPCVVAECLLLGILFLASNRGGTAELVHAEDRDGCLFAPDAATLAQRLAQVLKRGHRRARMAIPPNSTREQWIASLNAPLSAPAGTARACATDQPQVSVCLVRSGAANFRACLESVRAQGYPRLEILIAELDDGETRPVQPVSAANDVIQLPERFASKGAARNAAAAAAHGDYLLFIDEATVVLLPAALDNLVCAAQHTGAAALTGMRAANRADRTREMIRRAGDFPIGACSELGVLENCFGESLVLVESAAFKSGMRFAEHLRGGALDWQFLASAVLDGRYVEVVPATLVRYHDQLASAEDGERTVEEHRSILDCYRSAPVETLRRISEMTLQVPQQNNTKMQRALQLVGKAARDIATTLAGMDASSTEAAHQFVRYCCERRAVELAIDFALHNDVPFLPDAVTAACRANRSAAIEATRARRFDVLQTIDMSSEILARARPFHRLTMGDLRLAGGRLEQTVPSGDSIIKLPGTCPPGARSVRVTVTSGPLGSMRCAVIVCRSFARPILNDETFSTDGSAWWSGWSEGPAPGAACELEISLGAPISELLDLYFVVQRLDAERSSKVALHWSKVTVDVWLVGDVTPSALEMSTKETPMPSHLLGEGRLLTEVSDVPFATFVPGERTLLHPLHDRLVLLQVPDALPQGCVGLRCIISVEHAEARPVEFGLWARPPSSTAPDERELDATGHFSGWVLVDTPLVPKHLTLHLPQASAQPLDLFLATRVVNADNSYFCHAYWQAFSILEEHHPRPMSTVASPGRAQSHPTPRVVQQEDGPDVPATSAYLICTAPRTGSNLLATALRATRRGGWPLEYFNVQSMNAEHFLQRLGLLAEVGAARAKLEYPDLASRLDHILRAGTHNGIFGATVHWWDVDGMLNAFAKRRGAPVAKSAGAPDGMLSCLPNLKYVWLRRENQVAQAISHYIAIKTSTWSIPAAAASAARSESTELPYHFEAIRSLVVSAQIEEQGWRDFFADGTVAVTALTYEQLAADFTGEVGRVARAVGIVLPDGASPRPAFGRQSDARSLEWEQRYREEEAALE